MSSSFVCFAVRCIALHCIAFDYSAEDDEEIAAQSVSICLVTLVGASESKSESKRRIRKKKKPLSL